MKEKITSFDIMSAFKALDEVEIPVANVKHGKLSEAIQPIRTESLLEDYYNVTDQEDMNQAAEERAAEVAQAKLARIEKIVDLDASSPEELQPSYVGKMIVQCPQCMTLFYKDEADLNYSDEDPLAVNVGETCQHCGNDSGYSLIGKVDAAEPAVEEEPVEAATEETVAEEPVEEPAAEENAEVNDESAEDAAEETENIDLAAVEIPEEAEETEEEEVTESLTEDLDSDMKEYNDYIQYLKNMLAQDEEALEKAKKMKDNEFAIAVIEKRIAADKEDLDAALPKIIKEKTDELPAADETSAEDLTDNEAVEEKTEEATDESLNNTENASENKTEEASTEKTLQEARTKKQYSTWQNLYWDLFGGRVVDGVSKAGRPRKEFERGIYDEIINHRADPEGDWNIIVAAPTAEELDKAIEVAKKYGKEVIGPTAHKYAGRSDKYEVKILMDQADYDDGANMEEALHEDVKSELALTDSNIDAMLDSKEFNTPISDEEVQEIIGEDFNIETLDDIDECNMQECIEKSLKAVYENVEHFTVTGCALLEEGLVVDGMISFNSGAKRSAKYVFTEAKTKAGNVQLIGLNEEFGKDSKFIMTGSLKEAAFTPTELAYSYSINESLVEGSVSLN